MPTSRPRGQRARAWWLRRWGRRAPVGADQSGTAVAPNDGHVQYWRATPEERDVGALRLARNRRDPMTDDADDLADLLRRAGRGDQAVFAELYDRLAPLVYGVVVKVVRDPSQSDEVTQEVFVELWRLAARFDGTKGAVRSWAATLAHRRAIDRVRSEQAARDRNERDFAVTARQHDDVVSQVEATFDQARVRRALERLSPLQREALELAYYGGHTYREVAVLLGVAEGTVKTRIRDAMIRLRDELGEQR